MKLPEKKDLLKQQDNESREYTAGWNATIEYTEYLCNEYDEDAYTKERLLEAKERLLKAKEFALETAYGKGWYDCIVEIENLNSTYKEEKE